MPEADPDRLESWKEIASYLHRSVTTVQRWEREERLPVHRQRHDSLGSIYALTHELEAWRDARALTSPTDDALPGVAWRHLALVAGVALVAAATGALTVRLILRPAAPRVVRLTIATPPASSVSIDDVNRDIAITPDGSRIVYVGANRSRLFARALDTLDPAPLTAPGQPRHPFISPSGEWVGFFDGTVAMTSTLKRVAIAGGDAVPVCVVRGGPRGATWGDDDTIVFATFDSTTGLFRVRASGGEPTVLTVPDRKRGERDHLWPEFLPGGRSVLFTIVHSMGDAASAEIAVLDLRSGARKILISGGSDAHYVASGHLVYAAGGTLRAVAFDLERQQVIGPPIPVLPAVLTTPDGAGDFAVAENGTLVYVPGGSQAVARTLTWVDRHGLEVPLKAPVRAYTYPRLSPDGSRVALDIRDQQQDIWIWDLARETLARFTLAPGQDQSPVWTPDGRRLVFASTRNGAMSLYSQPVDDGGSATALTRGGQALVGYPSAVSPDGAHLIFRSGLDLLAASLNVDARVDPLVHGSFATRNGEFAPDGKWLAYESNESGRFEIYAEPFPRAGRARWRISTDGGTRPLWGHDGRELFYVSPNGDGALMSVRIEYEPALRASTPTVIFDGRYFYGSTGTPGRTYDLSKDGQRFLMIKSAGAVDQAALSPNQLIVVLNWFEELKRVVPRP